MTFKDVANMIKEIGLPYTYYSFPEEQAPNLPYLIFYYPNNNDMSADNINYVPISQLNIELYSNNKNFDLEEQVEAVLTNYGFYYSKTESYLNSEHMYEVLYETQIIITK